MVGSRVVGGLYGDGFEDESSGDMVGDSLKLSLSCSYEPIVTAGISRGSPGDGGT